MVLVSAYLELRALVYIQDLNTLCLHHSSKAFSFVTLIEGACCDHLGRVSGKLRMGAGMKVVSLL